jgi:hypothetical protein
MICPHCNTNLKRKERTSSKCSKCSRPFVFEPKDNPLALHDVKLRRMAAKLAEGGHNYTVTQLWYASARKTNKPAQTSVMGCGVTVAALIGAGVLTAGIVSRTPELIGGGGVLLAISAVIIVLRLTGVTKHTVTVKMPLDTFRTQAIGGWARVYGGPPPGLYDDRQPPPGAVPTAPAFSILSPDVSVLTCLRVNNVERRFNAALATRVADLPPGTPVAVVRDASVDGEVFLATARHELHGRRVVDLGLRTAAVVAAKDGFRLRGAPDPDRVAWLRANTKLTAAELTWLEKGWWSPVAALRPAQLLARVEKVATHFGRAGQPSDPDQRAAAAVGFMTWPAA